MIRRAAAAVSVAVFLTACAGIDDAGPGDLEFDLLTGSAVVVAAPQQLTALGQDEIAEGVGSAERVGEVVSLYQANVNPDQVRTIDVDAGLPVTVIPFFRDGAVPGDIGPILGGEVAVEEVLLVLERRSETTVQGFSLVARVIAVDATGDVVYSDWDRDVGERQLRAVAAHLTEEAIPWSEALPALIDAVRGATFDRPIESLLGEELLEVIRTGR